MMEDELVERHWKEDEKMENASVCVCVCVCGTCLLLTCESESSRCFRNFSTREDQEQMKAKSHVE